MVDSGTASIETHSVDPLKIREQIKSGIRRRDLDYVKRKFKAFSVRTEQNKMGFIPKEKVKSLLKDLNVNFDLDDEELFSEIDCDSHGLEFEEFVHLMNRPSPLSEWSKTLNVHHLIVDAFPRVKGTHMQQLQAIVNFNKEDVKIICDAVLEGLQDLLLESCQEIKNSFEAMKKKQHLRVDSKFSMIPMSCGKIEDFHAGIENRIGTQNFLCISL